jgi:hypothetical protein
MHKPFLKYICYYRRIRDRFLFSLWPIYKISHPPGTGHRFAADIPAGEDKCLDCDFSYPEGYWTPVTDENAMAVIAELQNAVDAKEVGE